ncbi:hypothetical protein HK098_003240 [Nowakowskiella sp. JEL0407]|nr:hypothetical protein HK098_003240 [Nowakowskiella sp. JEL0407]
MNLTRDVEDTDIPDALDIMVSLIVKEQAITEVGIKEGGCTELFLNTDMLGHLIRLSEADVPRRFRGEVCHFISQLISLMDGKFLVQNAVHRPILYLLRRSLQEREPRYEDKMVELSYNIASKIHEYPFLLNIFFIENYIPKNVTGNQNRTQAEGGESDNAKSQKQKPPPEKKRVMSVNGGEVDFLLWDHLIRSIHLQGGPNDEDAQQGDFARTGCLFLLELVKSGNDMEKHILSTDFANVIVAGLGGLFSQLPRALPSRYESHVPPGTRLHFTIQTFRNDLGSFLQLLQFVQEVVTRCPSETIRENLLSNLKSSFLETILLSSIQSSHDFDGSTAAVLFYIKEMLKVIETPEISKMVCVFLFKGEEEDDTFFEDPTQTNDMKLHVRDILISKLNSLSEDVVIKFLNLLQVVLSSHSRYALPLLIESLQFQTPKNNVKSSRKLDKKLQIRLEIEEHRTLVSRYLALLPPEDPNYGREHTLEAYIQAVLNNKIPDQNESPLSETSLSTEALSPNDEQVKSQMQILGRDSTLRKFISKFSTFFSHSYDINLALTGMLSQLAAAPEPLLYLYLFSAEVFLKSEPGKESTDTFGEFIAENQRAAGEETEHQSLYSVILKLQLEIEKKRSQMPNFDANLAKVRDRMFGRWGDGGEFGGNSVIGNGLDIVGMIAAGLGGAHNLDFDVEFLKNVVVLEEGIKELLAIMIMHGSSGYDLISYL